MSVCVSGAVNCITTHSPSVHGRMRVCIIIIKHVGRWANLLMPQTSREAQGWCMLRQTPKERERERKKKYNFFCKIINLYLSFPSSFDLANAMMARPTLPPFLYYLLLLLLLSSSSSCLPNTTKKEQQTCNYLKVNAWPNLRWIGGYHRIAKVRACWVFISVFFRFGGGNNDLCFFFHSFI